MTHPELIALLAGLRESPTDDAPRLVLADWLDEHGESDRAAFVRAQCGCFPGGYQPPTEVPRLAEWVGEPQGGLKVGFGRGLIHVHFVSGVLNEQSVRPELLAAWRAGWVDAVTLLYPLGEPLDIILKCDWFELITALGVSGVFYNGTEGLQAFTDSPMLANLHTLRLGRCHITDAGQRRLRESPNLPRLRVIDATGPLLTGGEYVRERMRVVGGRISLRDTPLDDTHLSALVYRPEMVTCHTLDLSNTNLRMAALDGLLTHRPIPQISKLDMSRNEWLGPLQVFANRPALPNLERLNLGGTRLTTPDLLALARSPHRGKLRSLNLRGISLRGGRVGILTNPQHLPNLERLSIDEAGVSRNGLRELRRRFGDGLVVKESA